jgi:hypothetical protein
MTKSVLDLNPNPDFANEYSSCCNMLSSQIVSDGFRLPCNPDHNGECLVCDCWLSDCWLSDCWLSDCWLSDCWLSDCWLSDCEFLNKEPEYHFSPENNEWLKKNLGMHMTQPATQY